MLGVVDASCGSLATVSTTDGAMTAMTARKMKWMMQTKCVDLSIMCSHGRYQSLDESMHQCLFHQTSRRHSSLDQVDAKDCCLSHKTLHGGDTGREQLPNHAGDRSGSMSCPQKHDTAVASGSVAPMPHVLHVARAEQPIVMERPESRHRRGTWYQL
jgi:hypothetical protein